MCENKAMTKKLLGGFLGLYVVAAISLKLLMPVLPADQVSFGAVTGAISAPVLSLQGEERSFSFNSLTYFIPFIGGKSGQL